MLWNGMKAGRTKVLKGHKTGIFIHQLLYIPEGCLFLDTSDMWMKIEFPFFKNLRNWVTDTDNWNSFCYTKMVKSEGIYAGISVTVMFILCNAQIHSFLKCKFTIPCQVTSQVNGTGYCRGPQEQSCYSLSHLLPIHSSILSPGLFLKFWTPC